MTETFESEWSKISLEYFDYDEPLNFMSEGFKFDAEFEATDKSQLPIEQLCIGEAEFGESLRAEEWDIPPPLLTFYKKCKQHFYDEYTDLLDGCVSNASCIKNLKEFIDSNRLMKYFKLELNSRPNFGKSQCFQNAAAKFATHVEANLKTIGEKIQKDIHDARAAVLPEAVDQLRNCSDRFLEFGKAKWMDLCRIEGSAVNILDQLYAVKPEQIEITASNSAAEVNELTYEMEVDQPTLFKVSAFIYALAIHDSKAMVNDYIRTKQAKEEKKNDKL